MIIAIFLSVLAIYLTYVILNPWIIKSQKGEIHFKRWKFVELPWFGIYIHKILKSDEDLHPHSHPWDFISLILKGGYWEYDKTLFERKLFQVFSVNKKQNSEFHKIDLVMPTWTLIIRGRKRWGWADGVKVSDWNYWVDGKMVNHQVYRHLKNNGELKDCHPEYYIWEGSVDV